MTSSSVHVEVNSPPSFERVQVLLRILLAIVLGWLGITAGWLVFGLYLLLPVIAAVSISIGPARFRRDTAPQIAALLAWLLQLSAYMMLLTDRFPAGTDVARIELPVTSHTTVGGALRRLVSSLPSGAVLLLLWFASGVLWLVAAVAVLVGASIPDPIMAYQRGVLRWQARLVAYHACLVDEYPPVSFDTHPSDHGPLAAAEAR